MHQMILTVHEIDVRTPVCVEIHYLFFFREFQLSSGLSKTNNTVCGIESAESDYLTFLDNSFCPENTDCLPNGQCLFPCQKTSDCLDGEQCER